MINFNVPPYTGKEMEYVMQCVENQKICGDGPFTKKCNEWIEKKTGTGKCLLTTSCTHATEMAALLADIKPGDEVIMPAYTFVSTADGFVLRGATPVFVDIRPDTMNIDENKIEAAITEKTKAIVPVHYAGVSCEMDKIMELARKYNLVTNFGKFMDPLADKLLVCSALICLIALDRIPAWIVIVIISREFIISGFRLIAADNGVVIAASYWGKFKTASQMVTVILLVLNIQNTVFTVLGTVFIYISLVLTVVSLIDYIAKNKEVLKDQN